MSLKHAHDLPPQRLADLSELGRKRARLLIRLHERAAADLDVEQDRVGPASHLLADDRADDERDARHCPRHVAERVHLLVRGVDIPTLRDNRDADVADLREERLGVEHRR